ncbi:MAG: hypothetical protein WD757_04760 [Actinomycetota bacterium]
MNPRRIAARAAFAAAGIHLVTSTVSLTIAKGLPAGDESLPRRIEFVREHLFLWRLTWLLWATAAVSLLALYVSLYRLWKDNAPVAAGLALVLAAAGFGPDLVAGGIFIGVLPGLGAADYSVVETVTLALTGYAANGLYTAAGILLTWAGRKVLPPSLVGLAALVWLAGLWLSVATISHAPLGQLVSTALVMGLFILWSALLGLWLERGRDRTPA